MKYDNIDINYRLFVRKLIKNKFGGIYYNYHCQIINKQNYIFNYAYKLIIIDNTCNIENYNMKPIRFYDKRPYFIHENKLHLLLLPMQVKESNSETFHTALLCIEFPDKIN